MTSKDVEAVIVAAHLQLVNSEIKAYRARGRVPTPFQFRNTAHNAALLPNFLFRGAANTIMEAIQSGETERSQQ